MYLPDNPRVQGCRDEIMMDSEAENQTGQARETWDREADHFDEQPDHGLHDPAVRAAWVNLLRATLPEPPKAVLDVGCGTGTLSVLLAGLDYTVTGIDLSPEMITRAEAKAAQAGLTVEFQVMDAAHPDLPDRRFEVLLCRHLLWALPRPGEALSRWAELLKPGGQLILIEGFWHTGAGLHAAEILEVLSPSFISFKVKDLSSQPDLWGGPVLDERYIITARC
jgi:ubiquinone/menaquinone biosynthesis C-methylase UbiE